MRLRGQYTVIIGGLVSMSLLVLGATLLAEQRRYANEIGAVAARSLGDSLDRQVEKHGVGMATSLAYRLVTPLYHRDVRLISHEAEKQRSYPDVLSVVVVDTEGNAIPGILGSATGTTNYLGFDWVRDALSEGKPTRHRDGERLRVAAPAVVSGHILGAVILELAMDGMRGDILAEQKRLNALIRNQSASFTLTGVSLGIVLLTLAVLAAVGVAGGLSRPITALAARARRVGQGELVRSTTAPRSDELGDLSQAFDEMATSLQQTTVSKDYFDNVLRSMADMLLVVDAKRRIVTANPSCLAELRCNEEDLRRLHLDDLLPGLDPSADAPSGAIGFAQWQLLHRPDGGRSPVRVASAPLHQGTGVSSGWVLVMQNISDRLAAERQVERSLAEKETLLREIHHRVKNNLQIISSMLGLQGDRADSEETREVFRESSARIRAMAIVHEQLYRSEDLGHVNLTTYLEELAQQVVRYSGRPGCPVEIRVHDAMRDVSVDRAIPIGLIVNELVSNAVQHGFSDSRSGTIRVELGPEGGENVLSVSDDGVGVPSDFDIKTSNSLGLKLVVALSEQIGGRFAIVSNNGTRCTVTMAAALRGQTSPQAHTAAA